MKTPDLPASDADNATPTGPSRPPIEIRWHLVDSAAELDGALILAARQRVLDEVASLAGLLPVSGLARIDNIMNMRHKNNKTGHPALLHRNIFARLTRTSSHQA